MTLRVAENHRDHRSYKVLPTILFLWHLAAFWSCLAIPARLWGVARRLAFWLPGWSSADPQVAMRERFPN